MNKLDEKMLRNSVICFVSAVSVLILGTQNAFAERYSKYFELFDLKKISDNYPKVEGVLDLVYSYHVRKMQGIIQDVLKWDEQTIINFIIDNKDNLNAVSLEIEEWAYHNCSKIDKNTLNHFIKDRSLYIRFMDEQVNISSLGLIYLITKNSEIKMIYQDCFIKFLKKHINELDDQNKEYYLDIYKVIFGESSLKELFIHIQGDIV